MVSQKGSQNSARSAYGEGLAQIASIAARRLTRLMAYALKCSVGFKMSCLTHKTPHSNCCELRPIYALSSLKLISETIFETIWEPSRAPEKIGSARSPKRIACR